MAGRITYEELKALLTKSEDLVLIDVRSHGEVRGGRIPGSIHIPLHELNAALLMQPDEFKAKFNAEKPPKNTPKLVFYCQTGGRGRRAAQEAKKHGYDNVYNYEKAYDEWSRRES